MKKDIVIDGVTVPMKCTGATPAFYRELFKHDLFKELAGMQKFLITDTNGQTVPDLERFDFGIVERLAYTMAYQADRQIGSMVDWLDRFEHSTAILDAMADIIGLYMEGLNSTSEVKKKNAGPTVK